MHLAWTAYDPDTPEIDVASGLYMGDAEVLEEGYTVVDWVVVMPLVAETVHEDDHIW